MQYTLIFTKKALKDIESLDVTVKRKIITKFREIENSNSPMKSAKALKGDLKGYYRYRIGDYRAIFRREKQKIVILLLILRVKHRKDIYKV